MKLTCCLQFFNFVFSKCAYCTLFGDMLSNAMCDFFLEVDNFACSRFSLKEWAVTCILQKYFPVKI